MSISNSNVPNKASIRLPLRSKREIIEAEEKPPRTTVNFDAIPEALKSRRQWVLWKWVRVKGKKGRYYWTKIPCTIKGRKAKANDPKTWATFAQVRIIFEGNPQYDGIGYEFSADDPFTGIDLDHAIDLRTGELQPWATKIVADFGTYTDRSPTLTGAKLFAGGKKPAGVDECMCKYHDGEIEIYDRTHFFTVTGNAWPGTPSSISECPEKIAALYAEAFGGETQELKKTPPSADAEPASTQIDNDDAEIIRKASSARNGDVFSRLHQGSLDGYASDSEADLAYLSLLGRGVNWDVSRMDRIFRSSGRMREKWNRKDYRERTLKKACEGKSGGYGTSVRFSVNGTHKQGTSRAKESPSRFAVGPLVLQPGQPRQMDIGRISVPVNTVKHGAIIFPFVITTSPSSRREPDRISRQLLGDDPSADKIDGVLTAILADAAGKLANKQASSGPIVYDLLAGRVPEQLQLSCRTARGIWSETLKRDIVRAEFVTLITPGLIDECAKASDVPRDITGQSVRGDLIRMVGLELGVVWAHLLSVLPAEEHTEATKSTELARSFRQAMVKLWTGTQTFELRKEAETASGEIVSRASLISRVRSQAKDYLADRPLARPKPREKWRPIQHAFDGWWRPWEDHDGQTHILLAMRWTLADQAEVTLPGVTGQDSLTRLGERFGVLQEPPQGVGSHFNRGMVRLAILAIDLVEELIAQPLKDEEIPGENAERDPGEEG